MRKFLIAAAVATTALTGATPAAAQYYPAPQGNAYGYQNNYGQIRRLEVRVVQLRRQIDRLDSRNRISEREADRLRGQANDLRRDLRRASRGGLHPNEIYRIERQLARLEYRIQRDVRDDNRWGQGNQGWDRDRDGRDDRYEDDRGRDRDDRRDRDDDDDDD